MKTMIRLMTCAVVAAMSMEAAKAALNIPSDGSDGALVITANTVIDLSQAVTGNWAANNSANMGKGIYDSNKWAVVFKYSSVTVQGGATVTFKNHASRAPVVWLVQGDVTINGTVGLNGQNSVSPPDLAEPGPGGFRGGNGTIGAGAGWAAGFGPGGGGKEGNSSGWGAAYGSTPQYGGATIYGNTSDLPLIGGSGGGGVDREGGSSGRPPLSGGAGGGAMLIACGSTLTIAGEVRANGGIGRESSYGYGAGSGSGGALRLICENLVGSGYVQAIGGTTGTWQNGGLGRVRIERVNNANSLRITPDASVVQLASGATPQTWLPANGPSVRIVTIGTNAAPADPRAGFGAIGADVVLPRITNVTVVVETTYVEWPSTNQTASVITVRATPRSNGNYTEATAAFTSVVSEDPPVARWTANVPVQDGYSAIQVKVVRP